MKPGTGFIAVVPPCRARNVFCSLPRSPDPGLNNSALRADVSYTKHSQFPVEFFPVNPENVSESRLHFSANIIVYSGRVSNFVIRTELFPGQDCAAPAGLRSHFSTFSHGSTAFHRWWATLCRPSGAWFVVTQTIPDFRSSRSQIPRFDDIHRARSCREDGTNLCLPLPGKTGAKARVSGDA
jgi:hypothetical protein